MLVTAHAAVGVALATVRLPVRPEFATVAAVTGRLGGVFPDLDVLFEHRKTLQFPAYHWVATVPAGALALVSASAAAVAALFFLLVVQVDERGGRNETPERLEDGYPRIAPR